MGLCGRPLRPSPADHVLYPLLRGRICASRHSNPLLSSPSSLHAHSRVHNVSTHLLAPLSCGSTIRASGRLHCCACGRRGAGDCDVSLFARIPNASPLAGDLRQIMANIRRIPSRFARILGGVSRFALILGGQRIGTPLSVAGTGPRGTPFASSLCANRSALPSSSKRNRSITAR